MHVFIVLWLLIGFMLAMWFSAVDDDYDVMTYIPSDWPWLILFCVIWPIATIVGILEIRKNK